MLRLRALLPCSRTLKSLGHDSLKALNTTLPLWPAQSLSTCTRTGPTCASTFLDQQYQQHRWASSATQKSTDDKANKRIYYGNLTPRMRAVKIFSLTTSVAGIAAQPMLLEQGMQLGGTPMAVLFCSFAGFFTFVTPVLLHFITKKYVTEIHYNPNKDEYTATTVSIILRKIQTKFNTNDVKVPDVPGMFTSFLVKDRPLFVDPSQFEDTEHYVRIMGYDKPIDFKLELTESEAKVDKTQKKS